MTTYKQYTHRLNLSPFVGYPLSLDINTPSHPKPLYWFSLDDEGYTQKSQFLQAPGFSLNILVPAAELARLAEPVAKLVFNLPEKQYQILQAMLISNEALELALSNPLLFILLVVKAEEQQLDENTFKNLVTLKRTHLLDYVGLPAKPTVARLLVKTSLNFTFLKDLETLPWVLNNPDNLHLMQHVKQPSMQHFLFIRRYRETLKTSLLNLITPETTSAEADHLLRITRDSFRMGMQPNQLASITSLAELEALHDRLIENYNATEETKLENRYLDLYGDYPSPPLPGNDFLQPLNSWFELIQEGNKMRHCVASYHYQVSKGTTFIYHANASKQLTLALVLKGERWVVDEVKGFANSLPTKEDLELIFQWHLEMTKANEDKKAG